MNITQQRTKLVLERMIKMVEDVEDDAQLFNSELDTMLEKLYGHDAFGTEGQCDPRGDGRNGSFDMWCVEGIDDVN